MREIDLSLEKFIRLMPKVELHVHLEGSIRPEILLKLASRNNVSLPGSTIEGLQRWYQFSDFDHFTEVYATVCKCLRTPSDFELIANDFLKGQAAQNIKYSEVIFTPYTHHNHVTFDEQLAAINRARKKAEKNLGVYMALVPDIAREIRPVKESLKVVHWAARNMDKGIIALGLGGPEIGNPPQLFHEVFERARAYGLPALPHAGETEGSESIWGAINSLAAIRIGHGVRCLEDQELVNFLRERQIPLDVSPTSNVCLGVAANLAEHPLPKLIDKGLFVTINSDDPPMFNTTLTDEYINIANTFGFDKNQIENFVLNGIRASLLSPQRKNTLKKDFKAEFIDLDKKHGLFI